MKYPASIVESDGVYVVSFRDIPEALTQGYTITEALMMAEDALLTAMDFYFEDMRVVPQPSEAMEGEFLIALPLSAATKILLLNTLLKKRVSKKKLA
ncbi:MAG: type II toxin-antitoxin system HicB family antitoxin, partial [Psychrobacter sp.]|nr:type II toxin-antitoxin system HicB family antitoxin [Psychrobacter sp.]